MKLLIVNGSPRAPRSNSRRYAELFQARWKGEARYAALTAKNHAELAAAAADCTDLLLVFPQASSSSSSSKIDSSPEF